MLTYMETKINFKSLGKDLPKQKGYRRYNCFKTG